MVNAHADCRMQFIFFQIIVAAVTSVSYTCFAGAEAGEGEAREGSGEGVSCSHSKCGEGVGACRGEDRDCSHEHPVVQDE